MTTRSSNDVFSSKGFKTYGAFLALMAFLGLAEARHLVVVRKKPSGVFDELTDIKHQKSYQFSGISKLAIISSSSLSLSESPISYGMSESDKGRCKGLIPRSNSNE